MLPRNYLETGEAESWKCTGGARTVWMLSHIQRDTAVPGGSKNPERLLTSRNSCWEIQGIITRRQNSCSNPSDLITLLVISIIHEQYKGCVFEYKLLYVDINLFSFTKPWGFKILVSSIYFLHFFFFFPLTVLFCYGLWPYNRRLLHQTMCDRWKSCALGQ